MHPVTPQVTPLVTLSETRPPLILLPPSEGKLSGGTGPAWTSGTMRIDLDLQRIRVAKALRSAMRSNATERGRLLGVKGDALASATVSNKSVFESPTTQAIERYTGVLYGALDVSTLGNAERTLLDDSVVIFSGLWGLVTPSDPIPDYKLKMGARLGSLGRLSTWWRESITNEIKALADRRTVWNLLPKEHAGALSPSLDIEQFSVVFLEPTKSGELVAVSHWNKFLKGALVRHLLESPDAGPSDLIDWDHPSGFRLDPARTMREGNLSTLSFVSQS